MGCCGVHLMCALLEGLYDAWATQGGWLCIAPHASLNTAPLEQHKPGRMSKPLAQEHSAVGLPDLVHQPLQAVSQALPCQS